MLDQKKPAMDEVLYLTKKRSWETALGSSEPFPESLLLSNSNLNPQKALHILSPADACTSFDDEDGFEKNRTGLIDEEGRVPLSNTRDEFNLAKGGYFFQASDTPEPLIHDENHYMQVDNALSFETPTTAAADSNIFSTPLSSEEEERQLDVSDTTIVCYGQVKCSLSLVIVHYSFRR